MNEEKSLAQARVMGASRLDKKLVMILDFDLATVKAGFVNYI